MEPSSIAVDALSLVYMDHGVSTVRHAQTTSLLSRRSICLRALCAQALEQRMAQLEQLISQHAKRIYELSISLSPRRPPLPTPSPPALLEPPLAVPATLGVQDVSLQDGHGADNGGEGGKESTGDAATRTCTATGGLVRQMAALANMQAQVRGTTCNV